MMSTISSAEQTARSDLRRFRDVFTYTVRKNYGLSLILLGLLVLIQPISYYLSTAAYPSNYPHKGVEVFQRMLNSYLFFVIPVTGIVAMILMVRIFGYLHKTSEVDLWHSLPVRRSTLFLAKYAGLIVLILLPLILVSLWAFGIIAVNPIVRQPGDLYTSYPELTRHLVFDPVAQPIGAYAMILLRGFMTLFSALGMLLAVYVTFGSSFDGVAAFWAINVIWPLLVTILYNRYATTVPGITTDFQNALVLNILVLFSPVVGHYVGTGVLFGFAIAPEEHIFGSGYWFLFGLICTTIAFIVYVKRPSERAGSLSSSHPFYKVLRLLITLTAAFTMSAFFTSMMDGPVVDITSLIIGSLLAHVIVELIVARGAKTLLKSMVQYLVTFVLIGLIAVFISADGFGVNRYRPLPEQLEGVVFEVPNRDYLGGPVYLSADQQSEEVAVVIRLLEAGRERGRDRFGLYRPYQKRTWDLTDVVNEDGQQDGLYERYFQTYDEFPLKMTFLESNGRVANRTYQFDFREDRELTRTMYQNDFFLSYMNPLLGVTAADRPTPRFYDRVDLNDDTLYFNDSESLATQARQLLMDDQELDAALDLLRDRLLPVAVPQPYYNVNDFYYHEKYETDSGQEADIYVLEVNAQYLRNRYEDQILTEEKAAEKDLLYLKRYGYSLYPEKDLDLFPRINRIMINRQDFPELYNYLTALK